MDAFYDVFSVDEASTNYRLNVSGFTGNCGDSLEYHNRRVFSTMDRDSDAWLDGNCAEKNKGGFWFRKCANANPTGMYQPEGYVNSDALKWYLCYQNYSVKVYILKFKRNL